jgi:glutamine synthetase
MATKKVPTKTGSSAGLNQKFASVAVAKKFLKDNSVKYILAQFVNIHGVAKTKSVPVAHLDDILTVGAGFAAFAIGGLGIGPDGPDYMAVGDLNTLCLVPWQPGYARIVCVGHVNGKPHPFDTRFVLQNQVARLKKHGWTMFTGLEPEFSLLKKNAAGAYVPADDTDTLEKPCYDYKGMSRNRAFLERLSESLIECGLDVYQIDHEDANGQFEINYTYTDCLTSADHFILVKMAASEIANDLGLVCSFMPKPFANRPGNGMHQHISLSDGKRNLFEDKSDKRGMGLSKLAYQFGAGILAHAPALTALCNPTVNSYKRLVVGGSRTGATWAPAYISYGNNNRSTLLRVPFGRLEMRLPDTSCNPYLATAAIIAAGLDGVERNLDPGEPHNFNIYNLTYEELEKHKIKILPQNLSLALDALEADKTICNALGGAFIEEFVDNKRNEWLEYQRQVSDWEFKRYIEFF